MQREVCLGLKRQRMERQGIDVLSENCEMLESKAGGREVYHPRLRPWVPQNSSPERRHG